MSKIPQTKDELKQHFLEALQFLEVSSNSFDAGFHAEAKRLATTIRVLLHDTKQSQSLLKQLGLKDKLSYRNTAFPLNPNNLLAHLGLVGMRMTSAGTSYFAHLDDIPPDPEIHQFKTFETWWNEVVIKDTKGEEFTREKLIKLLSNQDGGAHVDPALDSSYAALKHDNSVGWVYSDGISEHPIRDIELHSVRQIAYELIETLKPLDIDNL